MLNIFVSSQLLLGQLVALARRFCLLLPAEVTLRGVRLRQRAAGDNWHAAGDAIRHRPL